jgi:ApbE superfamily uncharacterized protein (UPF0280 family)
MNGPQVAWLPDGRRLHMNHGPIDLIVEAFGEADEIHAAYVQAAARFKTILGELVGELPALRQAAGRKPREFAGPTAQRMEEAASRLVAAGRSCGIVPARYGRPVAIEALFLTPMAAVAGAVADEILAAMVAGRQLEKAYVNDGGDIAIHLTSGAEMKAAIAGTAHGLGDRLTLRCGDPVRGIATSGWRGRSFSLGIADAVTVLGRTAAEADAAATVIANAVDLPGHEAIERRPACELAPDSDLGERLVTTGVGRLSGKERAEALDAGLNVAERLQKQGLIEAAALFLEEDVRVCGRLGEEPIQPKGLHSTLPPSVLPDISPTRGEIGPAASVSPIAGVAGRAVTAKLPISPLVGEMSGRTEGGAKELGGSGRVDPERGGSRNPSIVRHQSIHP